MSICDFSTLYITLSHSLIKDKLVDLTEGVFQRECSLYTACNDRRALFTFESIGQYYL